MEQPKYYELGDDNTYCVHFANKEGLSIDRIREIFSEWGNVVGVTKAGDDFGYRFVRYRNEDEVKRCIEVLRNHCTIKLLPKKPKQRNNQNNVQRSKNNWTDNNQVTKTYENFNKFNGQRTSHFPIESNIKKSEYHNDKKNFNHSSQIENKCINGNFETQPKKILFDGSSDKFTAATRINREIDSDKKIEHKNIPITVSDKNELSSVMTEIGINSNPGVSSPCRRPISNEIPNLVTRSVLNSRKQLQNLSSTSHVSSTMSTGKQETVNAEEIVVANVSTDFSENYILHLFQKYEPICISPMKLLDSLNIRFCIVYFPSARQAEGVERKFDNHKLGNKNLIVLRPQGLRAIVS